MILEMGMDWMRLPWVTTVEILIGRMSNNAYQKDDRANERIDFGETTAARDELTEWLTTRDKTPEERQQEEDDALLEAMGLRRPKVEVTSD